MKLETYPIAKKMLQSLNNPNDWKLADEIYYKNNIKGTI